MTKKEVQPEEIKKVKKTKQVKKATTAPPEEYAALKEDFAQIIDRGIKGFQEKTPGRQIEHITMRLQGRYGLIVQTNRRGLIEVPEMSGIEMDNQGRKKKQRMIMGMNCSASTKKSIFGTVTVLRPGETTVKEFEANAGAHELLKFTVERAQKKGEELQRKIDEEELDYWPRYQGPKGQEASANWDTEGVPSIDRVFKLVTLARQTLKAELGAKLADCKIVFFHIVDTMEVSDSNGCKIDTAIPRTGFAIQAQTDRGNSAYDTIRGTGGLSVLTRHNKTKTPEEVIEELAKRVARYCRDIDRAQPCSILGGEAHVVLSGEVSGVLAHEVYGHTSESDIIVANKRDKDVDLNLKARLGGQVSENSAFNIIDDGRFKIMLGDKEITHCYGALLVDENGSPAQRTALVTNGIQTLVINSPGTLNEITDGLPENIKEGLIEHGLSGNFRNERYDKKPMVRMTNTFILPNEEGPKSAEEMAAMIPKSKKGVYVVTCKGGWVDPDTGQFEITGHLGYLIENGVITDKPVKNVIIHGHIAKFGGKIKAIGSSETVATSTGYCVAGETPILTDKGLVPIKDIQLNDRVLTHKGRFKKVKKVFKRTVSEPIYTVKPLGGLPTRLTGNHEIRTQQARKGYKWWSDNSKFVKTKDRNWTQTQEIKATTGPSSCWRTYASVPKATRTRSIAMDVSEERMELYGWYLAEGNLHVVNEELLGVNFDGASCESQADAIYSLIQDSIPEANPLKRYREDRKCWDVAINSPELARLFIELGRYSHQKTIPAWVYEQSTNLRVALLRGYWKGDGSLRSTRRGMLCSSASPQLIGGLMILLGQLGIYPSYQIEKAEDINKRDNGSFHANHNKHKLEIAGPQADKLAVLLGISHLNNSNMRPTQHHIELDEEFLTRIQTIESCNEENFEVYNLYVEEDNSYVTPGMTLHNCGKNKQWVPVEDGGPLLLVEDAPVGEDKPSWMWEESFHEYRRQMLEVACGKRKKSEVYLKFVEDATQGEAKKHSGICMLNKQMSVEDEVSMLRGGTIDTSDYILGVDGKLEEK